MIFYIIVCLFSMSHLQAISSIEQAKHALQNKQIDEALFHFHSAEKENPESIELLSQLGTIYFLKNELEIALGYFNRILELNSHHLTSLYNSAKIQTKLGLFHNAACLYERAYNLSQQDIIKGELFKSYIRLQKWNAATKLQQPQLWWYNQNIAGKRILLQLDKPGNGFGDALQFVRYAQQLHQAGAIVIVQVHKPLLPLLRLCPYINSLCTNNGSVPEHDLSYSICIASLLIQSRDRIAMHAPQHPYLEADPHLVDHWKTRLSSDKKFKIGLCFQSSKVQDRFTGAIIENPRSIPEEYLAHLAIDTISYYSLQKVDTKIDLPLKLTQFTADFDESHGRFMDTAALIMNMDLIITVDTSIAHLAGALGRPTWLILSTESDYRWFIHDTHSPLYPTVKLFRQQTYGDWNATMYAVRKALICHIKEHINES